MQRGEDSVEEVDKQKSSEVVDPEDHCAAHLGRVEDHGSNHD